MANSEWRMANSEWRMANSEWRVAMVVRVAWCLVLACSLLLVPGCGKAKAPAESGDVQGEGGYGEGEHGASPRQIETPAGAEMGSQGAASAISALGTVWPVQRLQLSFGASGPVRAVPVFLGMEVKEGDLMAELDTTALDFDLQDAQEEVALRRAVLDGLMDGSDAALVERAEAEHAQQVAEAEIATQVANWQLEQAGLQGQASTVAGARSRLRQLDLQLAQARAQSPTAEVVATQVALARAQDALDAARVAYQEALDRPWESQTVRDAHARALREAQREVQLAQAQRDSALDAQRAHALGVETLVAQRDEAEAQLAQALDAQAAYTVTLKLLAAEVDLAELRLAGLWAWKNPYLDPLPPEEIAQASARLRQAELTVARLEWQIRGAELRAPFDGLVSAVYLHPGEWGAAGVPAVELLDTTRWRVETRNVGELNIGRVQMGQEAVVRIIALGKQEVRGRIIAISPVAVVQQGDTTYTVFVELEPTDLSLRPGMNAEVEIGVE